MKKIKTLFKINPKTNCVENIVVEGSEWVLRGEGTPTEKFDGTACRIWYGEGPLTLEGFILYKRYDRKLPPELYKKMKKGEYVPKKEDFKEAPPFFEECDDSALSTGHIFGWVPVDEKNPNDQWHIEAWKLFLKEHEDFRAHMEEEYGNMPTYQNDPVELWEDRGTYELVGPKIQGNPYGLSCHELWKHGSVVLYDLPDPLTFEALQSYFWKKGSLQDEFEVEIPSSTPIEGIVWHHPDGRMVKLRHRDFAYAFLNDDSF